MTAESIKRKTYCLNCNCGKKYLVKRAHIFNITEKELKIPLSEIKVLVKKRHRELSKKFHPDLQKCASGKRGFTFRRLQKNYEWFMALTEKEYYPKYMERPLPWHYRL